MDNRVPIETYSKGKDIIRARLLKYWKKAYMILPEMENPLILDIGCGSGMQALELAALSRGHVVGLDNNRNLLNAFKSDIEKSPGPRSISLAQALITGLPFKKSVFDLIWVERATIGIDFLECIREWRQYLKGNGHLILHDDLKRTGEKLGDIEASGYKLINQFSLTHDIWWYDYYSPLEKLIKDVGGRGDELTEVEKDRREILMFKKNPDQFRSVFYIMKRFDPEENAEAK